MRVLAGYQNALSSSVALLASGRDSAVISTRSYGFFSGRDPTVDELGLF
jgi:hypothetical protein